MPDEVSIQSNYGHEDINDDHRFVWVRTVDGEIFGHIEHRLGRIIPRTSGFWRTHRVDLAVKLAQDKLKDIQEAKE